MVYGSTTASEEWQVSTASSSGKTLTADETSARSVPRSRIVGGLLLLAVCGLALVAGSVRTPRDLVTVLDETTDGVPADSGNKQEGQPTPLACEAHLRSEIVLDDVDVTNMTSIQKSLLETVAEDAIGKVLNAMTGFQAMTAIWSYPVDGKCWIKFYFQMEFIVIPGDSSEDEVSTGEELTNRAMRFLVKKIQNGDMAEQWWDSNIQLGAETFLFGNITKTELEDKFDEEMSIYAVDEYSKLLWLETCTPPTVAPQATYAPSISDTPIADPTSCPSLAPSTLPSTYKPTSVPVVPYPAPTVGPQISPTPHPSKGPTDSPTHVHTPVPTVQPTEAHMTCIPSPCPGRKLDEFGVEVDMTFEEAAAQAAEEAAAAALLDAERAALVAAEEANHLEQVQSFEDRREHAKAAVAAAAQR